ncbi:hypothetical protein PCASD_14294 [Puccinia coronata f. sp. avenae]|uniref:Secreted protein n=1 Tax=Puccinia coronata f. sp. avenae TaxID=200324 RepID=A0A2N5TL84_9BASI|nr:hypothetical protein PCASD_24752 [Puccinia coronata f. sp. avenae]PLW34397.1 hypothetical protein PCASD_14294 [Puccinia coronata f. sp. avenae]
MVQQLELLVLVPAAGAVGLGSSSWSCWSWFQQLPAIFGLSWSCWSQHMRPMLPTAEAVGLSNSDQWFQLLDPSVSDTETNPNSWSHRSQKLRPMLPTAGAVGLSM